MKKFFLMMMIVTFSIITVQSATPKEVKANPDDAISMVATGTGRTTGHIANLSIKNTSDNASTVEVGPFFIPSGGQYQPYIVPSVSKVTVPAHGSEEIQLFGYCTDIHVLPVPSGEKFPPVTDWVKPLNIPANWTPTTAMGWIPVPPGSAGNTALIPGTGTPLGHTIDAMKHPAEASMILLEAINRISIAYDKMKGDGTINTPFSSNPEKERESVIQQTFWIYAAGLEGKIYVTEDFRKNTIKQYEANGQKLNDATPETKDNIEKGVNDFWNTFEAVGVEAKVLSFSDSDEDEIEKESDLPKLIQPGYQKYAAARALGSSHEKALKDAFPSEDAQKKWGDTFKKIYKGQGGK